MTVKTIQTADGRTFKLGRRPFVVAHPRLKLANYLVSEQLPQPPPEVDYSPKAMRALREMYLNDQLGDCVPAWMCHAVGVFTGNASGVPVIASSTEVEKIYSEIGGYVPGNPDTDNGCDENTALAYWEKTGIVLGGGVHKIQGPLSINAANEHEVRVATWLFENVMYGVGLPDAWVNPFPSGDNWVWKVVGPADPNNGHCFGSMGYNAIGNKIATWVELGCIEYAATVAYAVPSAGGQLFSVITQEILNRATQRAPNNLNWQQLTKDFHALGA